MSDTPFKMRGFPKHSGVKPKSSPAKWVPALAVLAADEGISHAKKTAKPGSFQDFLTSQSGFLGGPIMGSVKQTLDLINLKTGGKLVKKYPKFSSFMGYDKGGFSALGRKGTDIRKKRMQYQKQQEAILAKKKLKKQSSDYKKTNYTKTDLKKYGPGHPKRKKVYDALNWKYDKTIKNK